MKIKITDEIEKVISGLGNKTIQRSGLMIYAAMYSLNRRKNKHGYFACNSAYLHSINSRYSRIVKAFIEAGIINYRENIKPHPTDIFKSIRTKDYSVENKRSMRYKFLIDVSAGREIDVPLATNRKYRWYEIVANSLAYLGYEPKIGRDSFGRRVHYPLIQHYKTELKNKGLWIIDAKTSQPRLLYTIMKERGIEDIRYNHIFENEIDFYLYIAEELCLDPLPGEDGFRDAAKNLFPQWLNSSGYVSNNKIFQLFPVASAFIKSLKVNNYKDCASFMQREEAKIWIDDLLQNIPVDFALPVHDSLIVKAEDFNLVLGYCKDRHPEIRFDDREL